MRARLLLLSVALLALAPNGHAQLEVGAHAEDITPTRLPVILNGGFLPVVSSNITDRLHARALALTHGDTRAVLIVVDTCLLPREFCDRAAAAIRAEVGDPALVVSLAATHCHSAPSLMTCHGTPADPHYPEFLLPRLVAAARQALANREPAEMAYGSIEVWDKTFCRHWIHPPGREGTDPFGERSCRADMNPADRSGIIGPTGPKDPELFVLAFRSPDGRPIAALANYSMHYFGVAGISADYFGRFAHALARRFAAETVDPPFVGILSAGTSGDANRYDFSQPRERQSHDLDRYAREMADQARLALSGRPYQAVHDLGFAQSDLTLPTRQPSPDRLAQSRAILAGLADRPPRTLPEIYAREQIWLHENPTRSVRLQALRLGEVAIAFNPCEMFALTGLKIKGGVGVPLFNIELANGADGYLPPRELHALGGYTTWACRTAGLAESAEEAIVTETLRLLREELGLPAGPPPLAAPPRPRWQAAYREAVQRDGPVAYWPLDDLRTEQRNLVAPGNPARAAGGIAVGLPGFDPRPGPTNHEPYSPVGPGLPGEGRAVHLAGGHLQTAWPATGTDWTLSFWAWNGWSGEGRTPAAVLAEGGAFSLRLQAAPDGTLRPVLRTPAGEVPAERAEIASATWRHYALVAEEGRLTLHLDGEAVVQAPFAPTAVPTRLFLGADADGRFSLEGKLDEVALFGRALPSAARHAHLRASGFPFRPLFPTGPLDPSAARASFQLEPDLEISLVAAEPQVESPCALAFDDAGRLWVAENRGYPNQHDPPLGRIARLEDRDGDGHYESRLTFAEGLDYPNGLLPRPEGLYVTCAPDLLLLRDRDGDGRADERVVLLTGFATTGSTQLRVNDPTRGPDGWIWLANGLSGGTVHNPRRLDLPAVTLRAQDLRFNPAGGAFAPVDGRSQFGLSFDPFGRRFLGMNRKQVQHVVLSAAQLARQPRLRTTATVWDCPEERVEDLLKADNAAARLFPLSEQLTTADSHQGTFTAACGVEVLDWPGLPARLRGQALSCDPTANAVHRDVLLPHGATFVARRDPAPVEFLRSRDTWFRPVFLAPGPGGALYLADFYRETIEHPDYLPEEVRRATRFDAGRHQGRIWRITARPESAPPALRTPALDPGSREGEIADLARRAESDPAARRALHTLADDPEPRLRFLAALALGDLPDEPATIEALARVAHRGSADPWTRAAALSGTRGREADFLDALLRFAPAHREDGFATLVQESAQLLAVDGTGRAAEADSWLKRAEGESFPVRAALAAGLNVRPPSALHSEAANLLLQSVAPEESRLLAAGVLALALAAGEESAAPILAAALTLPHPGPVRQAAARALGQAQGVASFAPAFAPARWAAIPADTREAVLHALFQHRDGPAHLLHLLETGTLAPHHLSVTRKAALRRLPSPEMKSRAERALGGDGAAGSFERWRPALDLAGEPGRGRAHFQALCAACHRLDGLGHPVGPDLFDVRNQPPPAILRHLLAPDAEVHPAFAAVTVALRGGGTLFGVLGGESEAGITLRLAGGLEEFIARARIAAVTTAEHSYMPTGLEEALDIQGMADLLAFLRGRRAP
jgi:putative membrane-bound dehydrogenase-like protein